MNANNSKYVRPNGSFDVSTAMAHSEADLRRTQTASLRSMLRFLQSSLHRIRLPNNWSRPVKFG